MSEIRSICVYCGSSVGEKLSYLAAATALGTALGQNGIRLVYGGGTYGIMGAVAQAALNAHGQVLGIIPRFLLNRESSQTASFTLTEQIVTENMHERKKALFENSDAFIALPGGIGTLEEIVEIMTWAQLGQHQKPIILANIEGFWDPFLQLLQHMKNEGFIHTANLVTPTVVDNPQDLIAAVETAFVD